MSGACVRLEAIADILGHRSPTITADIYRHPVKPVRDTHLAAMTGLATELPASTSLREESLRSFAAAAWLR